MPSSIGSKVFNFANRKCKTHTREPPVEKLGDFGFGNIRWGGFRLNIMHYAREIGASVQGRNDAIDLALHFAMPFTNLLCSRSKKTLRSEAPENPRRDISRTIYLVSSSNRRCAED
jgi:hypothetical protein